MESTATHHNSSSLKVVNNTIIGHFSFLLLLGLAQFHGRKPIFRGALYLFKGSSKKNNLNDFNTYAKHTNRVLK
jgi:hypothetical protein